MTADPEKPRLSPALAAHSNKSALAGQKAARDRGVKMGRPATMTSARAEKAKKLLDQGMSKGKVGKAIGVSRTTVYNWLEKEKFKK